MLIENSFDVAADPDRVFAFLRDPHNVASCFPGAELTEELGDDKYRGKVKIKLGPVTAAFSGTATITELDEAARVAVLVADGKDARGAGTAKAIATMRVEPRAEGGSSVQLTTDLTISGKLAQFGRGIMADVSNRMVGDLATRVRERIEAEEPSTEAEAPQAEPAGAEAAGAASEPAEAMVAEPEATGAEAAGTQVGGAETAGAETTATGTAAGGTGLDETADKAAAGETPATRAAATAAEAETTARERPAATGTATGTAGSAEAPGKAAADLAAGSPATASADATAPPPAKERAPEPAAGAIKASTMLKVIIAGMFRRLFARLRGRSTKAKG
jgi:carbon monoxide dehydrogenase subunit G